MGQFYSDEYSAREYSKIKIELTFEIEIIFVIQLTIEIYNFIT